MFIKEYIFVYIFTNIVVFFLSAKKLGLKWPEKDDLDLNPMDGLRIPNEEYKKDKEYEADFKRWRTHVRKRRQRIPDERKFNLIFFCVFQISV